MRDAKLGQERGIFTSLLSDLAIAEMVAGLHFDTLQRWLASDEPPFDLKATADMRLDIVLQGLRSARGPIKSLP